MEEVCSMRSGMEIYCDGCSHQVVCVRERMARLIKELAALRQKVNETIEKANAIKKGAFL